MAEQETLQAERVVAGNCPTCGRVVIIPNNYEVWPLVKCSCGAIFPTTAISNRVRVERSR